MIGGAVAGVTPMLSGWLLGALPSALPFVTSRRHLVALSEVAATTPSTPEKP